MKYTMVNGTADGRFELLCYKGDTVVLEKLFNSSEEAQAAGNLWLSGKLS